VLPTPATDSPTDSSTSAPTAAPTYNEIGEREHSPTDSPTDSGSYSSSYGGGSNTGGGGGGYAAYMKGHGYPNECSWQIDSGDTIAYSATPTPVEVSEGDHTLNMFDSFGDGWNGADWTLKTSDGGATIAGPFTFTSGFSSSAAFIVSSNTGSTPVQAALTNEDGETALEHANSWPYRFDRKSTTEALHTLVSEHMAGVRVELPSTCNFETYRANGMCRVEDDIVSNLLGIGSVKVHATVARDPAAAEGLAAVGLGLSGSFVEAIRNLAECTSDTDCEGLGPGIVCTDFAELQEDDIYDAYSSTVKTLLSNDDDSMCFNRENSLRGVRALAIGILGGKSVSGFMGAGKSTSLKLCAPDPDTVERNIRDNVPSWKDSIGYTSVGAVSDTGNPTTTYGFTHLKASDTALGFPLEPTGLANALMARTTMTLNGYSLETFDNRAQFMFKAAYAKHLGINQAQVKIVDIKASIHEGRGRMLTDGLQVTVEVTGLKSADQVTQAKQASLTDLANSMHSSMRAGQTPKADATEAREVMEGKGVAADVLADMVDDINADNEEIDAAIAAQDSAVTASFGEETGTGQPDTAIDSGSGSAGAIVGGVIGGLVIIALAAALFVQHSRAKASAAAAASEAYAEKAIDQPGAERSMSIEVAEDFKNPMQEESDEM
jgi:hypothetical protein